MESITRRSFAAGVAAAGLATSAIAANAFASEAAPAHTGGNVPDAWDLECEVLALGGGCAGMSAAYKAAELGADVMLLESRGSTQENSTYYCRPPWASRTRPRPTPRTS